MGDADAFEVWRAELREAMAHAASRGLRPEQVLRGDALDEAQSWLERTRERLAPDEHAFVERAVQHRLQREKRGRRLLGALAVLVWLGLIAYSTTWDQAPAADAESSRSLLGILGLLAGLVALGLGALMAKHWIDNLRRGASLRDTVQLVRLAISRRWVAMQVGIVVLLLVAVTVGVFMNPQTVGWELAGFLAFLVVLAVSALSHLLMPPVVLLLAASSRHALTLQDALTRELGGYQIVSFLTSDPYEERLNREIDIVSLRTSGSAWREAVRRAIGVIPIVVLDCRQLTAHLREEIAWIEHSHHADKLLIVHSDGDDAEWRTLPARLQACPRFAESELPALLARVRPVRSKQGTDG